MNLHLQVEANRSAPFAHSRLSDEALSESLLSDSGINLTANENRPSNTALRYVASPVSARYLLGRAKERNCANDLHVKNGLMLRSFPKLTALEHAAAGSAALMFGAQTVDFRPLSGLHATTCAILALTRSGELVFSISPQNGGHFATANLLRALGRKSAYLPWDDANCTVDLAAFGKLTRESGERPAVLLDHGTALFPLPVSEIRELIGASMLIYDGSHTLGLIAGGRFQDPLSEGADIIQGNTHKTFPGPQKALVCFRDNAASDSFDQMMSSALVSSSHTHHLAALCITVLEMELYGRDYARATVENAQCLAEWLGHLGLTVFRVKDQATQSHMIILTGFKPGAAYRLCERLNSIGINVNARSGSGGEFIRIGVQEITRRGVTRSDIRFIAEFISLASYESTDLVDLRTDVEDFAAEFKTIRFSFD